MTPREPLSTMRFRRSLLVVPLLAACARSTAPGGLAIEGDPDLVASVARVEYSAGNTPAGYVAQYNVWLVVPPGSAPNAGVVLPMRTPVFVRQGGEDFPATLQDIHLLDPIELWHDRTVGYGAVECPPNAPCYTGTQVVILR